MVPRSLGHVSVRRCDACEALFVERAALGALIEAEPVLQLVAPVTINIVCYRYRPVGSDGEGLKALNTEIMLRLQEEGTAALSDTTVRGEHCLRVAITNHRTRRDDLELLVRETIRLGDRIVSTGTAG